MNFDGVVINVADLDRSVHFYREVLGFTLLAREEQLAVVGASGSDRTQALVLREFGSSPIGGARHVGLRAFLMEADSADQLQQIASALDSRGLLMNRRDHSEWNAVVGRDPDEVAVALVWHSDVARATEEGWKVLDNFLYGIGE